MKNPREALEEIRQNVEKIRAQGTISPTENALFGMLDGMAALMHVTMARVTELERRVGEATGQPVVAPAVRDAVRPNTPAV
jgi:hypothetical protein